MILLGQFDSPFVRRVGVALELYQLPYQHRPWSVFGDADKIAPYNPLLRVPTLVLDDGEVLIETLAILDALDEMAGDRALIAASGPERRKTLKVAALAGGVADKVVASFYGSLFHKASDDTFLARQRAQIETTLDRLEADRANPNRPWWIGAHMTHADIAVAATMRHLRESVGQTWEFSRWPALEDHCAQCEALPVFQKISQPFIFTPAKD
jgi:glutathione S-transferase